MGRRDPLPISLRTFASSQLTSIIQEISGTYLIGSVNGVQRHKGVVSTYMQNVQQGLLISDRVLLMVFDSVVSLDCES